MKFFYEAIGARGDIITGEVDANSEREAIRLLSVDGITVTDITPPPEPKKPIFKRKLKHQDTVIALFELSTLLESGVSIAEAVESQSKSEYHPDLNDFFDKVSLGLRKGQSLSAAMESTDLQLPGFFVRLIQAGELSGKLADCMRKGVEQMEYELDIANQLRTALIYPAVLVFSGVSAVMLIFVFVVPKFTNLLTESNDLPALAWFVLTTGMWFNEYLNFVIVFVVVSVFAIGNLLRRPEVRNMLRNGAARMPIVGSWLSEIEIAKWSSVMAAMLDSRVELVAALDMAQNSIQIGERKSRLEQVSKAVRAGENLSKALSDNKVLSPIAYNLIRVGEKAGNLAKMLFSVSKVYDTSCRNRMKAVVALIEPLSILIIGSVIGVLVLGIILAITSVNTVAI